MRPSRRQRSSPKAGPILRRQRGLPCTPSPHTRPARRGPSLPAWGLTGTLLTLGASMPPRALSAMASVARLSLPCRLPAPLPPPGRCASPLTLRRRRSADAPLCPPQPVEVSRRRGRGAGPGLAAAERCSHIAASSSASRRRPSTRWSRSSSRCAPNPPRPLIFPPFTYTWW
ncbi:hypothetical protein PVAP13_3KG078754 [Panicum virgatum]|uniref:Uncharacterized protein n=1 Tax=Panicum virgatum TaxID=38727 RepID=A0A8T0UMD9_PANVG|nr:hypothetical protein PVAP13_3KG078754 [Panicum virgatum]